jgi:hypothetical protein
LIKSRILIFFSGLHLIFTTFYLNIIICEKPNSNEFQFNEWIKKFGSLSTSEPRIGNKSNDIVVSLLKLIIAMEKLIARQRSLLNPVLNSKDSETKPISHLLDKFGKENLKIFISELKAKFKEII